MEFGNDTAEEWSVINAPQKQDPTYYKVATGLLLTSAILTLALIQYFKRNKKSQRGQPCPGCQNNPAKDSSGSRMFPHAWRNLFAKKSIDSPRIGLLQESITPSQSQENSPNVRVRLKRRYRTNLALGNKLVDLSKHGYMVTRTKKARNDHAKPVTAISQTDIPGHSTSPRVQSLRKSSFRPKRKLSSVSNASRAAGPENRDPNMCQVELYREMTKALRNNELSHSSISHSGRNLGHSADDLHHQQHREESIDGLNAIPLLQVNGVAYSHRDGSCVMDCACGPQDSAHFDNEEEEEDEGQLQCALKYDQKSSTLSLRSVCVKTSLDPGIPGFLVEISLLPHNSQTARSKVYVTARCDVDITLRETFRLRCMKDDIAKNTLSIAVKPMFCSTILYAETDLNELTLISGKEIFLGGYLKSLSHHFN